MKKIVNVKSYKYDEYGRIIEERTDSWEEDFGLVPNVNDYFPSPTTQPGQYPYGYPTITCNSAVPCADSTATGKDGNP